MPYNLRIGSADYNAEMGVNVSHRKFDSLAFSVVGSAVYTVASAEPTAWSYSVLVSSSATGWSGSGVSAGGVDTLRSSFAIPSAVVIVTEEAQTATAYFRSLKPKERLNPTMWLFDVSFDKAT
jgi:hypothetical protein